MSSWLWRGPSVQVLQHATTRERDTDAGRAPVSHRYRSSVAETACKVRTVLGEEETAGSAGAPHLEGPGCFPTPLSPHFPLVWSLRIASGWAQPPALRETRTKSWGRGGRAAAPTRMVATECHLEAEALPAQPAASCLHRVLHTFPSFLHLLPGGPTSGPRPGTGPGTTRALHSQGL